MVRLGLVVLVGGLAACTVEDSGADAAAGAAGSAAGVSSGGMTIVPASAGTAGSDAPSVGGTAASMTAGTGGNNESGGSAGISSGGSSGGIGGSSDGGGGGASPATRSAGCGMATTQALGSWVEQPKLSVNNKDRQWWVWLPTGYDPTRAYPVVFTFHGCGGANNFIPMQKQTGSDAIVVRGTGADNGCWTYGTEGDDVKFFDAMLAQLQTQSCMDTSRVFAMGYSSGGWMTNTLECSRGDKLRATGTLSGGRAGNGMNCKGKFARATVHDLTDPVNPFDKMGASPELDRVLAQNHCKTSEPPVMEAPAPCARYQGCDAGFPVIACRTMGQGHNRQDTLAMDVFWKLFSSL
jgi:poly(3-hydroxybutyrate) depolymerase